MNSSAQAQDAIDYCEAWYEAVSAAGYTPGMYVGAGTLLNGRQICDLPFRHYWRSQSQVPDIPHRGYQLIQLGPSVEINGIWVDLDVALNDSQGGANIPRAREELGEVCCAIDSHVDRTFRIEVFLLPRSFFERSIMNNFRRNSARLLASRKECYGQKNRSAQ